MEHGKCQCNFEKYWYKIIQKVKTLPINNNNNNIAAVFPISIKHLSQARKRDLGCTNFK